MMDDKSTIRIHKYNQVNTANTINEKETDKYNVGDIDICNSSSTTDCTGLMFRPPLNEDETESYHQIYSFGPPDIQGNNNKKEK